VPDKPPKPLAAIVADRSIWMHLGWRDLKSRYAQTKFGPWLSVANLFAVIFGSSVAVGLISGRSTLDQAPRLAVCLCIWTLIASSLGEACDLFESDKTLLLNTVIHEISLTARLIWRNFIIGLHNCVVVVLVFIVSGHRIGYGLFLLPIVLAITSFTLILPVFLCAKMALMHRALKTIIPSIIQIAFFMTPILWIPPSEGPMNWAVQVNPAAWIITLSFHLSVDNYVDNDFLIRVLILVSVSAFILHFIKQSFFHVRKYV